MQHDLSEFNSKLLTFLSASALGVPAAGVTAMVDAERVGLMLTALVFVTVGHPRHRAGFLKAGDGVAGGDGVPPCGGG